MSKRAYNKRTRIKKFLTGISAILFLFYMMSCGSDSTSSPSNNAVGLDSIKALTLEGVTEDRITLSWNLLRTEEGVVDPTIGYTVYVETNDGSDGKVFTKDPNTETVYTLNPNSGRGTPLPLNDTGNRADGVEVTDLVNDTPYRIVVEARDALGNTVQSRLLTYTASEWSDTYITWGGDPEADQEKVTATWEVKEGAQSYALHTTESENQFKGGDISTENIFLVICSPESLLCDEDKYTTRTNDGTQLKYTFPIKEGIRYKIAIIPFNFRDLSGLQAVDEQGQEKLFTEEVLTRLKDETSLLGIRLQDALENNAREVKIQVTEAGPPVDLVLESTGNTLSANWEHGEGADFYYAFITSNAGVNAVTNIIDRYEPGGRFAGGGYTSFSDLTANTSYTVTVQSFTVIADVTNLGGEVSATLSTKDAEETLEAPGKVTADDLILTNHEAGKLRVVWSTPESNSVVGYNVFYWVGDAPNKPQYVAAKGETNLVFTLEPNTYKVRVDILSTYPGQEVVTGDTGSIVVYDKPSKPRDLGVVFSRGSFTEIENKLYATRYPLTYFEADTSAQAGGPVEDVSYHYRYRVAGGDWSSYVNIEGEAVIDLLVDDLGNADKIKAGYGKKYHVELVASNEGGFVSDPGTLKFTYKSFPEPFVQSENLKVITGDRSLTVTWPNIAEKNGSTVADYTVALSDDPYGLPLLVTNVVNRRVVFEGLVNNHSYLITVIPNDRITGNILTALSLVTGYTIGTPIARGSDEERILAAYTGVPDFYTPQGTPEAVVSLAVTPGENLATVTWEASTEGSPASKYVLEYLADVTTPLITNVYISGDAADAELSGLSWARAVSVEVETNETGSYSEVVNDLNVSSATNVFRVRPVRIDDSGKEWQGEYRYYALGTDLSRAPSSVGDLVFSDHDLSGSFTVAWSKPTNEGQRKDGSPAQLDGYRVSWGTTISVDEGSAVITEPNTLSYTITSLTPGTQYYVKVEAKNDNTEGNIYNVGIIRSTYTLKTPGAVVVTTIAYSGHTTNGFKVDWGRVTDTGYNSEGALTSVGYLLEWSSDQGQNWQSIARSDYLAITETLSGLTPGTRYRVRITTTNGFNSASPSEGGDTWSLSLPGKVDKSTITYSEHTINGFKVDWARVTDAGYGPQGALTSVGYLLEWSSDQGQNWQSIARSDYLATTETLSGLTPGTQYRVRVTTTNGFSSASPSEGGDTWSLSLPGKVGSITYSEHTTNGFKVDWGRVTDAGYGPQGALTSVGYLLEWSSDQGQNWQSITRSDYLAITETLSGLTSGTQYRVRVTTTNGFSSASPSEGGDTWSLSLPGKVDKSTITYSEHTTNGFKVDWGRVTDAGYGPQGALTSVGYLLEWSSDQGQNWQSIARSDYLAITETLSGLTPGTQYRVRVTTTNGFSSASPSEGGDTWSLSLPGKVDKSTITYSEHTTNGFKVDWGRVTDAGYGPQGALTSVGYLLEWSSDQGQNWQSIARSDYLAITETLSGLTPGTRYRVRVTTTNGFSSASPSEGGDTWTISLPGKVGSITYSEHTTNGFKVDWVRVTDAGYNSEGALTSVGYLLELSSDQGQSWQSIARSDYLAITETLSGLTSGTRYRVRVTTTNGFNSASPSEGGDTWSLSLPGKVGSITYSEHTTNGFKVDWARVTDAGYNSEGALTSVGYLLELSSDQGQNWQSIARSDYLAITETLSGLTPGTQYRVRVTTTNGFNSASPSEGGDTWSLSLPGKVGSITYSEHTTNGFKVDWGRVTDAGYNSEGALTSVGYLLEWSSDQGQNWQSIARSDYLAITETLSGLTSGTQYRVRVTTTNGFNSASPSEGGDTWTISLPGKVGSITYSEHTINGFKIDWARVTDAGYNSEGALTSVGYLLELSSDQEQNWQSIARSDYLAITETLSGLTPGTRYRVRVTTTNGFNSASPSEGGDTWALSLPGQVRDLVVSDPSYDGTTTPDTSGFKVSWVVPENTGLSATGGAAAVTGYEVAYAEVVNDIVGEYTSATHTGTATEYVFTGLKINAQYRIRVQAKTLAGVSAENHVFGWTPSLPGAVASSSILLILPTADTIGIEWAASQAGRAGGSSSTNATNSYKVEIAPDGGSYTLVQDNYYGTAITATGLSTSTTYRARITAKNASGEAVASISSGTGTTTESNDILRQAQPCAKTTSVDLAWDASSGATYYKLYRNGAQFTSIATTSYTNTGLTPATSYTYKVQACKGDFCSGDSDSLTITTLSDKVFKSIIDSGRIPADLAGYDEMSREIFSHYRSDVSIVAKYLKPGGTGDGSSFADAEGNLRDVLNGINDAAANKVYAVFLTGGNYQAGEEMKMKNHVAIVGGVSECLGSSDTATALDGEGSYRVFYNDRNNLDNTALLYGVTVTNGKANNSTEDEADNGGNGFFPPPPPPPIGGVDITGGGGMYNWRSSPSLVRVTFSGNTADTGGGVYNREASPSLVRVTFSGNTARAGGGMRNREASPSLVEVTFSGNTAGSGGGMHNYRNSSPSLERVTFSENKVSGQGGGMYNVYSSSPSLVGVTFSRNSAGRFGGGMYNWEFSSPSLVGVTFSENTATYAGGGIYNLLDTSMSVVGGTFSENSAKNGGGIYETGFSLRLIGVTFYKNTANYTGGAIFIDHRNFSRRDNNIKDGPGTFIVNNIFWENTDKDGRQLYIQNEWSPINEEDSFDPIETLNIYNSIVQGGTGTIKNWSYLNSGQGGFNTTGSLPMFIFFSNIIADDPGLLPLTDNGGPVPTHAITSTSPAANQGLYVRKSGDTFYYSENGDDWYNQGVYVRRGWDKDGYTFEYSTDYINWKKEKEKPDLRTLVTLPDGTEDLTATDATGQARNGRPDLGAYEAR